MLGPKNSLLKDKINVAKREHDEIRRYLAVLERNHTSYEEWICTLGELKHALSCHLKIEEEILALAKKTMKKLEFSRLINRMKLAEQKIFKDLFDMWALEAP
jgi:hypothetical protein